MASSSSSAPSASAGRLYEVKHAVELPLESVPVPHSFRCPLTLEIMKDPVATHDGKVYERSAIREWFHRGNTISPMTLLELPSLALTPEKPLQKAIEDYLAARPELVRRELDRLSLQKIAETLEQERDAKSRQILNPQDPVSTSQESLLDAVRAGDVARGLHLVSKADAQMINERDRFGRTALHIAAEKGIAPIAFSVLAHEYFDLADAEATVEGCQWTAIERAVCKGHSKLASGISSYVSMLHPASPSSNADVTAKRDRSRSLDREATELKQRLMQSSLSRQAVPSSNAHVTSARDRSRSHDRRRRDEREKKTHCSRRTQARGQGSNMEAGSASSSVPEGFSAPSRTIAERIRFPPPSKAPPPPLPPPPEDL